MMIEAPAVPNGDETFSERVAPLRRERLAREADYSEFVPALEPPTRSPEYDELIAKLRGHPIADAYALWSGKTPTRSGSGRREMQVSCPNPAHADERASASLNTVDNVGNCHACAGATPKGGFDSIGIYAWTHGHPVPDFKADGISFLDVVRSMGRELGYPVPERPAQCPQDRRGQRDRLPPADERCDGLPSDDVSVLRRLAELLGTRENGR